VSSAVLAESLVLRNPLLRQARKRYVQMKYRLTIVLIVMTHLLISQVNLETPCYKIEHLDFFGLKDILVEKLPDKQIQGLLELATAKNNKDNGNVNFIIPIIAYQLQEFHPKFNPDSDSTYLERIIGIYIDLRGFRSETLNSKNLEQKIDFIRDDFYELVKDKKNLIAMNFTLDDGPFYGIDTTLIGDSIKSLSTDFGLIRISKSGDHSIISCLDSNGNIIWNKIMTGVQGRELREINTSKNWIEKTSLATRIFLFTEGEQLTLYIRNDGEFMYYYHSW
jgi:hypothetical protein